MSKTGKMKKRLSKKRTKQTAPRSPPKRGGVKKTLWENKEAKNELEKSLSLLRATCESTADGLLVVDVNGKIVNCNRKFVEMWRIPEPIVASRDDNRALAFVLDQLKDPHAFLKKVRELYALPDAESYDVLEFKDGRVFERYSKPQQISGKSVGRVWSFHDSTKRKEAEDALAKERNLLRTFIDNVPDNIYVKDTEGHYLMDNAAHQRFLGIASEKEVLGKTVFDFFPRELAARYDADDRTVIQTGQPIINKEEPIVNKAGQRRRLLTTKIPLRNVDGAITGLTCISRDISDHKEMEENVRTSRDYARNMIDSSIDMIISVDGERKITEFNKTAEKTFGYSREEILGKSVDVLYADPQEGIQAHQTTIKKGECIVEIHNKSRDGRIFPCLLSSSILRDSRGETVGVMGISQDISDRRKMEETLRETSHTLQGLVQSSPLAIIVIDSKGHVKSWNKSAERIFGWKETEVVGHPLPYVPEDQRDKSRAMIESTFNGGMQTGVELRRLKKDGSLIDVALWTAPLKNTRGEIVALVGMFADITERKRMEEAVLQAQKIESLGMLAGGVAHDFNNIIGAVMGYSDLILRKLSSDDPIRSKVEAIRSASQKAAQITRQLLAFGRRQLLQPKVVDLNRHIHEMVEMSQRLIGENIEVTMISSEGDALIKVDPNYLDQVIMNLVVNARDAMPDGGKLTLQAAKVELDAEYAAQHANVLPGPYVMLSVKDTGHGMTPEVRARIFEPFFTTKDPGKGTGLGLSTVFGIVRQSGGHFDVQSKPGDGSTFTLYFPQSFEPLEEVIDRKTTPEAPRGSETILLVEDEEIVRKMAREILAGQGYTVLEARNGDEALKTVHQSSKPIHLLFTDIVLPGMSGVDLADHIHALSPKTKVLFTSGHAERSTFHFGLLDPAIKFLIKPYDVFTLAMKIREVLDGTQGVSGKQ